MKKTLSIIIVGFNSQFYLEECIKSLKKSTLLDKTEIIIVDNASTDKTSDLIRQKFPGINVIRNQRNLGFSKANNQGIAVSNGNYVLLLNPDTIVPPQTLLYMVEFMDRTPDAGISTCRVEIPDGSLDDACHRGFPTPWNALCHFSGLASLFPSSLFFNGYHLGYRNLSKTHEIDCCTGAFMLIRRSIGERLGWLDEDYFWYGEDIDFCFRVKKENLKVYFVPQTKILHYKGVSSGIKKHSQKISEATFETRKKASEARFAVMKIFYNKHLKDSKSRILMPVVFAGIKLKEFITLLNLKIKELYAHRI